MKRIIIFLVMISAILFANNELSAKTNTNIGGGVYFYSSLAPYGNWIQMRGGVTVWRPSHINNTWQPYTDGYWMWTDDGWYWESYEPFGYITYHYGRWYYDDYYGWIWVPDNQWAPAWVEWRYDNDYIGWAPLPPYAGFSINFGINFTVNYFTPYSHWRFVRYRHFCDPYVHKYYIPSRDVYRFYGKTRYRTNYGYSDGRVINRGVDIDFVRKRSGQYIRERVIDRVNDPGKLRNQNGRNSDRVRTYYVERDKLNRENIDVRKIERSDRRTSLDASRIGVDNLNRVTVERNSGIRNDTRSSNRQNEFNKRSTDERNIRSDSREREINKNRNSSPNISRERSYNRSRTENPVIRQERKIQKPEIKRDSRQTERRSINRQKNNRQRDGGKDRRGRGR